MAGGAEARRRLQHSRARAVPLNSYDFLEVPMPWDGGGEQVFVSAEILAKNDAEADARLEHLVHCYEQVLLGADPGPYPGWVVRASVSSFRFLPDGSVECTVAHPGSDVLDYRLDVNGIDFYATLTTGAVETTIGGWKRVTAMVDAADIQLATEPGVRAMDDYEVVLSTDEGDVHHVCEYWFELDS